jgi:hypothetical protein
MNYLLDTCTISEPTRKQPAPSVIQWLDAHDETTLFLSVLTIGELYQGIHKLSSDQQLKKTRLQKWIEHDLRQRFKNRILPLDLEIVELWGELTGNAERQGRPLPIIDSLIGATAIAYNMTVVTRNVKDLQFLPVTVENPWENRPA